jgi:hypothetical protein
LHALTNGFDAMNDMVPLKRFFPRPLFESSIQVVDGISDLALGNVSPGLVRGITLAPYKTVQLVVSRDKIVKLARLFL